MNASSPSTQGPNRSDHLRAVLALETAVGVTLARQRVSLARILGLAPGSVLALDTPSDAPLSLDVGGCPIATGQVVQIGDRLGLRIERVGTTAASKGQSQPSRKGGSSQSQSPAAVQ